LTFLQSYSLPIFSIEGELFILWEKITVISSITLIFIEYSLNQYFQEMIRLNPYFLHLLLVAI